MTTASRLARLFLRKSKGIDGRSLGVLTTAATSYLGRLGSALAILLTIPMVKSALAPDEFGVWMMLSGLLGFFAFADLGIGNGVLNRTTAAHATHDHAEQQRVMAAGYTCTGMMGLLLFGVWLCWAWLAPNPTSAVGDISIEHQGDVLTALQVFALLLAINIPASLVQKEQLGTQAGHWVGFSQFAAAMATLVGVPSVLALGGGLPALVAASLGMQVASNLVSTWLWRRHLARTWGTCRRIPFLKALNRAEVVSLLRIGSLFFVLQLAVALAFQSDAIVIAHQLGQVAYGEFAVIQRLFLASSSILQAGLSGLWPALGEALKMGDAAWVKKTLFRSYGVVFVAIGTVCIAIATFMPDILRIWLGVNASAGVALLTVLVVWTIVEAMGGVSGVFLNAAGVLKPQILLAILMSVIAFLGKWILVSELGAWGSVLATLAAYSAISIPAQVFLIRRQLRMITS